MLEALAEVVCFFRVRESKLFIREISRKLDIMKHYHCIHCSLLRAARGPAGEWYRTIGSSQASEGEPNTMVLKHILAPAAGTA